MIKADADLIAAGLLLDLKTDSKLSLGVTTMFQVIGYALLDFDDAYQLTEAGTFSARYAYLATWDIGMLFDELAGHHVSLPFIRQEFRELLLAHQLSANESLLQILQSGFVTGQVKRPAPSLARAGGNRKGSWPKIDATFRFRVSPSPSRPRFAMSPS